MAIKKLLSPEGKLMKAIFGKTQEEIEKEDEKKAKSVTEEEFKRVSGRTPEENAEKTMTFIGWCNAVSAWWIKNQEEKKYKNDGRMFSMRQVVDIARTAYGWGREDEKNGVDEKKRLWEINKAEAEAQETETAEQEKPNEKDERYCVGDKVYWNDPAIGDYEPEDRIHQQKIVWTVKEIYPEEERGYAAGNDTLLISDGNSESEVYAHELEPVTYKKVFLTGYKYLIKEHGKSTAEAMLRQVKKLRFDIRNIPENGSEVRLKGFKISVWNHEDRSMLEGMFEGFIK